MCAQVRFYFQYTRQFCLFSRAFVHLHFTVSLVKIFLGLKKIQRHSKGILVGYSEVSQWAALCFENQFVRPNARLLCTYLFGRLFLRFRMHISDRCRIRVGLVPVYIDKRR